MYWTQGVPDFFNNQLQPKQTISCPIVLTLWIKQLLCSNQAIHLSGNLFWSSFNPVIFSLARPFSFFLFSAQKHTRPKPPFFLPSLGRRDNLGWFPPSILSSLARSTIDLITDTLTNDSLHKPASLPLFFFLPSLFEAIVDGDEIFFTSLSSL